MMDTPKIRTADTGERTRAFRRARLNTVFVRIMRWLLPAGAVALFGCYLVFMQRTIDVETDTFKGKLHTGTVSRNLDSLAMTKPSYEGYNKKDGSRFKVSAAKAITDLSRDKPIKLEEIAGQFEQLSGSKTAVQARRGVFDQKSGELNLSGGITVAAPEGMRVDLNSARIDTRRARITSDEPVKVAMSGGVVRGNNMRLDQKERSVVFGGGVAASLKQRAAAKRLEKNGPDGAAPQIVAAGARGTIADGEAVDITAATLTISEQEHTARFTGNVRAFQNGRTLEAPELVVTLADVNAVSALSGAGATPPRSTEGRVRQIVARNGIKLSQGTNTVHGTTAIFDPAENSAEIIGEVRVTSPGNRSMAADRAQIDMATNQVTLSGRVVARQAGNLMRGTRLAYDGKTGRLRLTAPKQRNRPRGTIFVRFEPPQRTQRKRSVASGGLSFATNPNAPIEINAGALDVTDQRSTARFDGGVSARQGDLTLKAPVLTAHYRGRLGLAQGASGRREGEAVKIEKIQAQGAVEVTSRDDTRANGERATFDMVKNIVTLSGNVVVKRGRQIVRGDRLIIDLKTGLSRMKNAAPERNAKKPLTFGAAPKITANPKRRDCGGQMCAVFYPQDAQREGTAGKRAQKPRRGGPARRRRPSVDQGWSTSTSGSSTN